MFSSPKILKINIVKNKEKFSRDMATIQQTMTLTKPSENSHDRLGKIEKEAEQDC
jgi:hypothetical protein